VTHLDVSAAQIDEAISALRAVCCASVGDHQLPVS
jgi:hypothetical protein